MQITEETIEQVAKAARLTLSEEEKKQFTTEVSEILDSFAVLSEIDTDNVAPSFHPIPLKNRLRKDEPQESLSNEDALKNVAESEDGYIKGPKAV